MPSSSTGYHPATITKEQPTSSGQLMTWSSGCTANFKADSEIEMESGSTMNVESGAVIKVASGGRMYDQNVVTSTAAGSLTNAGISVLGATAAAVFTLAAPAVGVRKRIVSNCTAAIKIKGSTGDTVRFGSTLGGTVLVVAAPTSKNVTNNFGRHIELYGVATNLWGITSYDSTSVLTAATAT